MVAEDHPAFKFINYPNPYVHRFDWLRTTIAHALQHGNGYTWIKRNAAFEPETAILLDPEQTVVIRTQGQLYYLSRATSSVIMIEPLMELGKLLLLQPWEVCHIRGLSNDGMVGWSVLNELRDALGLGLALQQFGSRYFKNNGVVSNVIELPGYFKDKEELEHFLKGIDEKHGGIDNAFKWMVLQGGAKATRMQISNDEAQFILSREFDLTTMANVLGLPKHKLGASGAQSYNSLEQSNREFLADMEPWLVAIEAEFNLKLLTEVQKSRDSHYFEFKREALERGDMKAETDVIVAQITNGMLSLNQALALKNLPSIGEAGDLHRMPTNLGFVETLAETALNPPGPEPEAIEITDQPLAQEDSDDNETQDDRLARQLEADTARLLTRLDKALTSAAKQTSFNPRDELAKHEALIREALPGVEPKTIDTWLENMIRELEATTRDKVSIVVKGQRWKI